METSAALSKNKHIALRGLLIALAMILSYFESFIPVSGVLPGVKIGLANIVTIFALEYMGIKDAMAISLMRIFLSAILFGNPVMMIYSLAGAFLSISVMSIFSKIPGTGPMSVSICGAIFHNLGQCAAAALLLCNVKVFFYLPILLIAGVAAGIGTGLISNKILKSDVFPNGALPNRK